MKTLLFEAADEGDLPKAAEKLLDFAGEIKFFAFFGEMGSGKTTFIKAISRKLGVTDLAMSSPTFSLVNEYHTSDDHAIYHFDFYRIKEESEIYDIGYEHYFYSQTYCFLEWPEKIRNLLPPEYVRVEIKVMDKKRVITAQI